MKENIAAAILCGQWTFIAVRWRMYRGLQQRRFLTSVCFMYHIAGISCLYTKSWGLNVRQGTVISSVHLRKHAKQVLSRNARTVPSQLAENYFSMRRKASTYRFSPVFIGCSVRNYRTYLSLRVLDTCPFFVWYCKGTVACQKCCTLGQNTPISPVFTHL